MIFFFLLVKVSPKISPALSINSRKPHCDNWKPEFFFTYCQSKTFWRSAFIFFVKTTRQLEGNNWLVIFHWDSFSKKQSQHLPTWDTRTIFIHLQYSWPMCFNWTPNISYYKHITIKKNKPQNLTELCPDLLCCVFRGLCKPLSAICPLFTQRNMAEPGDTEVERTWRPLTVIKDIQWHVVKETKSKYSVHHTWCTEPN